MNEKEFKKYLNEKIEELEKIVRKDNHNNYHLKTINRLINLYNCISNDTMYILYGMEYNKRMIYQEKIIILEQMILRNIVIMCLLMRGLDYKDDENNIRKLLNYVKGE